MSDDTARPIASAGSGSRLPLGSLQQEWTDQARAMTFFGVSLSELGRDDLLAVCGYLADQAEQERRFHHSTLDIFKAASAAS